VKAKINGDVLANFSNYFEVLLNIPRGMNDHQVIVMLQKGKRLGNSKGVE